MAHNINFNNGKASFFSVREKAWHGLGQVVENAPDSATAIKLAGLDYTVEKQPVFLNGGIEIPDTYATVRTDTNHPFGIVKSRYEVLQNSEAFNFFDSIVGEGAAIYETGGALGDGETIFITAKLPEYIKVGKDDLIEQYLFLTNNHNGKKVLQAAFTPVRIVCNNTLNAALKNSSNNVRIMHNGQMKNNIAEAHKLMGIVHKMKEELETVFNAMAKKSIVDEKLKQFILNTFASDKQLEILASSAKISAGEQASLTKLEQICADAYLYAMESDTQQMDTTRGTVFGAYNAITGYLQNVKEVKDQESNLVSILDGSGFDFTQKSFNLATSLL
jgi:phage/plasmid-like protein (TIGR03299 family)